MQVISIIFLCNDASARSSLDFRVKSNTFKEFCCTKFWQRGEGTSDYFCCNGEYILNSVCNWS